MYDFFVKCKIFFFLKKRVIYLKLIFVSTFKKFISVKKDSLCKKIHSVKQTHSVVKHEFYFQFSFATNKQV